MGYYYDKHLRRFRIRIYRQNKAIDRYAHSPEEAQAIQDELEAAYPKSMLRRQHYEAMKKTPFIQVPCGLMKPADTGRCEPMDRCPHYRVKGGCLDKAEEAKYAGWRI